MSNFENTELKVQKTARLTWVKSTSGNARTLVVVLHGYGQLSTYFSRKFSAHEQFDFCFPEGLSRYYREGTAGRVGASWMTKEARLTDIADNQAYMTSVLDAFESKYDHIHLIGFSQGAATAARSFASDQRWDSMTIWAGVFPPELSEEQVASDTRPTLFVLGSKDQYFDDNNQVKAKTKYQELGFDIIAYDGPHDIQAEPLNSVLKILESTSLA